VPRREPLPDVDAVLGASPGDLDRGAPAAMPLGGHEPPIVTVAVGVEPADRAVRKGAAAIHAKHVLTPRRMAILHPIDQRKPAPLGAHIRAVLPYRLITVSSYRNLRSRAVPPI
jgi:hypothetical protein